MNDRSHDASPRRFGSGGLIVGRLESHGAANYHFRQDSSPSYFVKIATNRGLRILWGKDLARALTEARTQPKIGTFIGVRRTGYDTFSIPERTRGAAGQFIETQRVVHRNRWMVESAQFFAERAQLARRVRDAHADARAATKSHPELLSTFLSLRSAQAIAERRIANPEDRARFLELVRGAMANSIHKGEPMPYASLRSTGKAPVPPKTPDPKREDPVR